MPAPRRGTPTAGRPLRLRVVQQNLQGLVFARCKGIQEAASPLLAFVDDDNGLAANYLEDAVRIARDEPGVGAFGGITRLLTDLRIPEWKRGLMPYLGYAITARRRSPRARLIGASGNLLVRAWWCGGTSPSGTWKWWTPIRKPNC